MSSLGRRRQAMAIQTVWLSLLLASLTAAAAGPTAATKSPPPSPGQRKSSPPPSRLHTPPSPQPPKTHKPPPKSSFKPPVPPSKASPPSNGCTTMYQVLVQSPDASAFLRLVDKVPEVKLILQDPLASLTLLAPKNKDAGDRSFPELDALPIAELATVLKWHLIKGNRVLEDFTKQAPGHLYDRLAGSPVTMSVYYKEDFAHHTSFTYIAFMIDGRYQFVSGQAPEESPGVVACKSMVHFVDGIFNPPAPSPPPRVVSPPPRASPPCQGQPCRAQPPPHKAPSPLSKPPSPRPKPPSPLLKPPSPPPKRSPPPPLPPSSSFKPPPNKAPPSPASGCKTMYQVLTESPQASEFLSFVNKVPEVKYLLQDPSVNLTLLTPQNQNTSGGSFPDWVNLSTPELATALKWHLLKGNNVMDDYYRHDNGYTYERLAGRPLSMTQFIADDFEHGIATYWVVFNVDDNWTNVSQQDDMSTQGIPACKSSVEFVDGHFTSDTS